MAVLQFLAVFVVLIATAASHTDGGSGYVKLAGVVAQGGGGHSISTTNHSIDVCETACNADQACQGFTVDKWATAPPTLCRLFHGATALVDVPCYKPPSKHIWGDQYSATFMKPGRTLVEHS